MKKQNSRSIERVAVNIPMKLNNHNRVESADFIPSGQCSTKHSSTQLSTVSSCFFSLEVKEKKYDLITDYAENIDAYLKQLEQQTLLNPQHLSCHKINGIYRAKMVDWMVEVLTAFKCAD